MDLYLNEIYLRKCIFILNAALTENFKYYNC